jgi:SAM-dependent methyltransferase
LPMNADPTDGNHNMSTPQHSENLLSAEYYDKNAHAYYEKTINLDVSSLYEPFIKLLPKHGKILDAGCGSGRDSLYFKRKGFSVVSFDVSKKMVDLAVQLIGQAVLHMSFTEVVFEDEFDGIWACASLLHVPQDDIDDVFRRLSRALKRNGIIYASFKYGSTERKSGDRLFNDYDEEKLALLMSSHRDLKIERIWFTEDVRTDRKNEFWLNVLLRKA